ncbi:MAG: ATP-dependent RecD-like DNA helicase [Clostridia bacterium]|nr:ATP-dependent RecD-like DNA helicase [Clostridia bacterium]
MENREIKISGTIEDVIYFNPSNGYAVCDVSSEGTLVTMTGIMPDISEGERIEAIGAYKTHPEYGEQFSVSSYERYTPSDETEIEHYLSSGVFPYIGRATARAIVDKFGKDSLNIIENEPMSLLGIKGLNESRIQEIHQASMSQTSMKELNMFFQKFGISLTYSAKVYMFFGMNAIHIIRENPYALCEFISGITFEISDKIGLEIGFPKNHRFRIIAAIRSTLRNNAYLGGHTYLPAQMLVGQVSLMADIGAREVEDAIAEMLLSGQLIKENTGDFDGIYLDEFYQSECYVAKRLKTLSGVIFDTKNGEEERYIEKFEKSEGITLADSQREAILASLENSVMVITGGPGTGKTTITKGIIDVMQRMGKKVALTAPTGRAAKRMTEISGLEAKTIHRLLECKPGDDKSPYSFGKNENNPLDCDVLIVDEVSMVDITLMEALLKAFPTGARLVLVGDADQLPSVGAGNVLRDIIESDSFVCIKLTEIFRQARESMIVVNAHKINNGEHPYLSEKDNDFFFLQRDSAEEVCETIKDLCKNRLPKFYGVDSISQIQVLCPSKKTEAGVRVLNSLLQEALNPKDEKKAEKLLPHCTYRVGDKVMSIKNNYNIRWVKTDHSEEGEGVFNGDVGFVTDIDNRGKRMTVCYDDRTAVYEFSQLDEIEHAFAITVHKSQGSEFDIVIIPVWDVPRPLMARNLLYTAITRAKKVVVLVGKEELVAQYAENESVRRRYSGLRDKLLF